MNSNQTINGVPRELLDQCLAGCRQCDREKLRALLDAPQVESELSRMTRRCQNAELALKVQTENYEALKAAQPHGEPVVWQYRIIEDDKPLFNPIKKDGWIDTVEGVAKDMAERPSLGKNRRYEVRKLYAEQPQGDPVARVEIGVDRNTALRKLTETRAKVKELLAHPSMSFHQVALLQAILDAGSEQ